MNIYLDLFLTFAKIGAFTFGGGYAMIPLIENDCVDKKNWITHDEMMNMTVVAESTPGPVAINCATYIGLSQGGILGAALATLGVVLPSFLIIFAISKFLDRFLEITLIANAFRGIKIAVGLLIINAAVNMLKKMKKTPLSYIIFAAALAVMLCIDIFSVRISTIWLMLIAAAVSFAAFAITNARKGGRKDDIS